MWFATWDGINKFDGYSFKTYKAGQGSRITLANNRVDYMHEDKYGYLWLQTYDNKVHRFNPATEMFEQVPDSDEGSSLNIIAIKVLANGTVWLLTEKEGAVRVTTHPESHSLSSKIYSGKSGLFPSDRFIDVRLDSNGNEWLLTRNGLGVIHSGEESPVTYFTESPKEQGASDQGFYSFEETGDELLFGSDAGRVWRMRKDTGHFQLLDLQAKSNVVSVRILTPEEMLVATSADGFFIYHLRGETFTHYSPKTHKEISSLPVLSVYVDKNKEIWFEQEEPGCVVHFNPFTKVLKKERLKVEPAAADRSRPSFHIHEDIRGRIWVHPFAGGLSSYDPESNSLIPFYNEPGAKDWRFSNKVHSAFSDRQGNLWLGTHSKGLEKITFRPVQFHLATPYPDEQESLGNEVRALLEDEDGNIWVSFKNGELRVYNEKNEYVGHMTESGAISKTGQKLRGVVYGLLIDSKGSVWISTKGEGVVRAAKKAKGTYQLTRFKHNSDDIYSLSNDNVYCTYEDPNGRIWIATFAGGLNYLDKDEKGRDIFINHRNHLKGYPIDNCYKVRFVTSDKKGRIWVGTTTGAISFDANFTNPEDIKFNHYARVPSDPNSLSNNDVHWIINTKDDELFFATFGGGLNKLISTDKEGRAVFKPYSVYDGLLSDVLLSILEDDKKNLWMSTEHGISKFIPSEEKFENYDERTIMLSLRFNEAASLYTSKGNILFGSSRGVFGFHPDSIYKSDYAPPIILSQALDDKEKLVLHPDNNSVTIQYAALDYRNPANIQYAYMLEGFDKDWVYADKLRGTNYSNLPKGNYTFKVKSTNSDGVWVDNVRSLEIERIPSFWETIWAYLLYFALILLVIWVAVYILFTIYRLKHKVSVEQEISDIKLRFFTNVSHELRTPLTLIVGPLEHVLKHRELPGDVKEQLEVVERNTSRMLRLVNQILDFRKIQNKKMKMKVQKLDVVPFVRRVMANFDSMAAEHHLDYMLETEKDSLCLWVDEDKLEKIVFNLLSNAFKYTPNGKMISVSIREDQDTVSLEVRDQGVGIAENRKDSIFVRFENLVDKNLFNQSASTGIGLSLVKELAEMHKAVITVDSKLGEGSCFKVEFRKGREHFDESAEFIMEDGYTPGSVSERPEDGGCTSGDFSREPSGTEEENKESMKVMLLVEDNTELRSFLRSIFSQDFRIIEAVDGMEGWDKALRFLPDIIISDVMMPGKDGIEMMKELRKELTTSHIPIVLLTARVSIENKLEGLEYGADDYITKPFSATYLQARVGNILAKQERLQELYRANLMGSEAMEQEPEEEKPEMTAIDRRFMDKLMELMEKNMDNGDLMVDDLVGELAVSRSVFFKKLKMLTGLAPIEFIKELRIKRAAQLIGTGEFNMTQISYMVGINDPRYFSKCFKQKYNMTPTEYRDKIFRK